jgi:hypothetical protein
MIEAVGVVVAPLAEARPAEKLLALYASGLKAEAGKLTLGMIKETAESIKLSPKVVKWVQTEGRVREFPYSPTEVAEKIRDGWLRWVGENEKPEVVQHFSARWEEAFETARRERFTENLKAAMAKASFAEKLDAASAKQAKAEPETKAIAEKVKAVMGEVAEPADAVPEPAPPPKAKPKATPWPEAPLPPPDATPEERLLYPPGLLGHVVQHIIDTDMYPDRRMALWGGLAALSKATDRKVIGPTGSTTLLYLILLAATAAGKQHSHDCIRILLRAMGVENLIQAGGLASVQATEDIVKATPNCLVLIDEFGRWLRMVLAQTANVSELPGTLCKFWAMRPAGSWTITRRAREVVNSVTVDWPALALAGCSTGEQFWDACSDDEITGGFLNRCVIFDAGTGAKKRAKPKYAWDELPRWLAKELKERAGIPASAEATIITKTEGLLGPRRMAWGEGAEDLWGAAADAIRELPEGRKRDIYARGDELAVRLATVRAWWRGSDVVEVADWEWGSALAEASCGLVLKGANENMGVKRDFKKICKHVLELLAPGPMKIGDIHVHSCSAAGDRGMEIVDKALADLVLSEEIEESTPSKGAGRGRPTVWYRLK